MIFFFSQGASVNVSMDSREMTAVSTIMIVKILNLNTCARTVVSVSTKSALTNANVQAALGAIFARENSKVVIPILANSVRLAEAYFHLEKPK